MINTNRKLLNERLSAVLNHIPDINRRLWSITNNSPYYQALKFFEGTPLTEEAFYLKFQVLPVVHLDALKSFYRSDDEFKIFKLICKWWDVYDKKINEKTV